MMKMISTRCVFRLLFLPALCAVVFCAQDASAQNQPLIQSGQKVAFLGDSITANGVRLADGYVRLVNIGLRANEIKISVIGAGISGNTSKHMLARLQRDVLDKKPDWMTLSCGVNDVWHGARGVPLEDYKKNITQIVDQSLAAGVKVMILTSTPIYEALDNELNAKLAPYNDFLRALAREKGCVLVDLSQQMRSAIQKAQALPGAKGNLLTVDGVHMNPLGNRLMATGILEGFGLDEAQMKAAREAWDAQPTICSVNSRFQMSFPEYERLMAVAREQNQSVDELVNQTFSEAMRTLLADETTQPKRPQAAK
jgi:lysophospholipase L1-like esterase